MSVFGVGMSPAHSTNGSSKPALLTQGFIPVLCGTPWWLSLLCLSLLQHLCSRVVHATGLSLQVLKEVYLVPAFIVLF